jgi:DNA-directed RNA polymerase subunit RPC12/RpoP
MKCIRCGGDSQYQDRPDRRCPHCGGEVAFETKQGDPVSDEFFLRTIQRTSADGSLRFCPKHVYYDLWRSLGKPPQRFDELWDRFCAVHGTPAGTVTPWPARWDADAREADIGDYSFERAIITDSAWMVDFLLANNFHFETSSAILSIDGYPNDRFAAIRAMLHRNPRIIVIAVHDASYEGCQLARRLVSEEEWFRDHGHVVDIGLLPSHRHIYTDLATPRETPAPVEGTNAEARWLSKYTLDLGVVRPEKIMRRLFQATRFYAGLWSQPLAPGELHIDPDLLGPKQTRGRSRPSEED